MSAPPPGSDERLPGLRERKRQRTRELLLEAARQSFAEHGYEATTIDAIADRAELSARTVFRYFGSKEEIALADFSAFYDLLVADLRTRDAAEPPLQALTGAARAAWARPGSFDPSTFAALFALCAQSPTLLAALLRHAEQREHQIVDELLRRAGASADRLAIRVLVVAFLATLRIAIESWRESDDLDQASLDETLDGALLRLQEQLRPTAPPRT